MERYEHIITPEQIKEAIVFSPRKAGGGKSNIPVRNRTEHAAHLQQLFEMARVDNERIQGEMLAVSLPARTGTYLEFAGAPANDLMTKSLEDQKAGIRLLNIRNTPINESDNQTFATVFVPHGKEGEFISKLQKYASENTPFGKPKNDKLFRSIESVNIALLKSLWTDDICNFPTEQNDWYEVWIRINESEALENQQQTFIETLDTLQIRYKTNSILTFPERSVILVYANKELLTNLLQSSDQIAEFRGVKTLANFLLNEYRSEQLEWIDDVRNRVVTNTNSNSVVCILDTGLNNGHPLITDIVPDRNCATVVGEGSADRNGHGTNMCGITIYGDLSHCIANNNPIIIDNLISSVKLLPHNNDNPKESWGYLTEQAISVSDVIFPRKNICYCMAIT
ncbi:S8 family serine peptidase, partial [Phocaeicola vulgatus]